MNCVMSDLQLTKKFVSRRIESTQENEVTGYGFYNAIVKIMTIKDVMK